MALPRLLKKILPLLADSRKKGDVLLREHRNLSEEEAVLLEFVLCSGSESAKSFASQVPFAKMVDRCGCGCPTVGLEVSKDAVPGQTDERVIVDLIGTTPDGAMVGLLVFVDQGYLSSLEIYDLDDLPRPYPLPLLSSLQPFEGNKVAREVESTN